MSAEKEPTKKDLELTHTKELTEVRMHIERVENHFKNFRIDNEQVKTDLSDIKKALIGNELIGNKGLINSVLDIRRDVDVLKLKDERRDQNEKDIKWIGGTIIGVIFVLLVYIIQHLPK